MIFPRAFPQAPAIIVGIKRSDDVAIKYPQMAYKNCDEGKLSMPFVSISIKMAM